MAACNEWRIAWYHQMGVMSVLVGCLLPPIAPKLFLTDKQVYSIYNTKGAVSDDAYSAIKFLCGLVKY